MTALTTWQESLAFFCCRTFKISDRKYVIQQKRRIHAQAPESNRAINVLQNPEIMSRVTAELPLVDHINLLSSSYLLYHNEQLQEGLYAKVADEDAQIGYPRHLVSAAVTGNVETFSQVLQRTDIEVLTAEIPMRKEFKDYDDDYDTSLTEQKPLRTAGGKYVPCWSLHMFPGYGDEEDARIHTEHVQRMCTLLAATHMVKSRGAIDLIKNNQMYAQHLLDVLCVLCRRGRGPENHYETRQKYIDMLDLTLSAMAKNDEPIHLSLYFLVSGPLSNEPVLLDMLWSCDNWLLHRYRNFPSHAENDLLAIDDSVASHLREILYISIVGMLSVYDDSKPDFAVVDFFCKLYPSAKAYFVDVAVLCNYPNLYRRVIDYGTHTPDKLYDFMCLCIARGRTGFADTLIKTIESLRTIPVNNILTAECVYRSLQFLRSSLRITPNAIEDVYDWLLHNAYHAMIETALLPPYQLPRSESMGLFLRQPPLPPGNSHAENHTTNGETEAEDISQLSMLNFRNPWSRRFEVQSAEPPMPRLSESWSPETGVRRRLRPPRAFEYIWL